MVKPQGCLECGQALARRDKRARFCGNSCRGKFNQRRAKRGAELYDLFMAMRYDRKAATKAGAWSRMCRLGELYRDQDVIERDGRTSWQDLQKALAATARAAGRCLFKPGR